MPENEVYFRNSQIHNDYVLLCILLITCNRCYQHLLLKKIPYKVYMLQKEKNPYKVYMLYKNNLYEKNFI